MSDIRIDITGVDADQVVKYTEIFSVLISKGALDGVKGGCTIIHFDKDGIFQGIQLDYRPWWRRKEN